MARAHTPSLCTSYQAGGKGRRSEDCGAKETSPVGAFTMLGSMWRTGLAGESVLTVSKLVGKQQRAVSHKARTNCLFTYYFVFLRAKATDAMIMVPLVSILLFLQSQERKRPALAGLVPGFLKCEGLGPDHYITSMSTTDCSPQISNGVSGVTSHHVRRSLVDVIRIIAAGVALRYYFTSRSHDLRQLSHAPLPQEKHKSVSKEVLKIAKLSCRRAIDDNLIAQDWGGGVGVAATLRSPFSGPHAAPAPTDVSNPNLVETPSIRLEHTGALVIQKRLSHLELHGRDVFTQQVTVTFPPEVVVSDRECELVLVPIHSGSDVLGSRSDIHLDIHDGTMREADDGKPDESTRVRKEDGRSKKCTERQVAGANAVEYSKSRAGKSGKGSYGWYRWACSKWWNQCRPEYIVQGGGLREGREPCAQSGQLPDLALATAQRNALGPRPNSLSKCILNGAETHQLPVTNATDGGTTPAKNDWVIRLDFWGPRGRKDNANRYAGWCNDLAPGSDGRYGMTKHRPSALLPDILRMPVSFAAVVNDLKKVAEGFKSDACLWT
ncbi:hypothetical protein H4582DRAFT_2051159 [Lactarius indigo]|nr:hypothetical protein H4582DRAFT_2051159 [Lactarius indigo]